jgi:hypothetical protein
MAAATRPVWFQLYVFRDRAITARWCNAPNRHKVLGVARIFP